MRAARVSAAPHPKLSRLSRFLLRLTAQSRGNAAVELALTAPVLFMFIVGVFEMGRMLWVQNALSYAVAQAARCASNATGTCGNVTQTESYAAAASGYSFSASVFSASVQSCGNQVSASYPISLSIPYVPISVTLTALACYPS
jgi:hypothetical protein